MSDVIEVLEIGVKKFDVVKYTSCTECVFFSIANGCTNMYQPEITEESFTCESTRRDDGLEVMAVIHVE